MSSSMRGTFSRSSSKLTHKDNVSNFEEETNVVLAEISKVRESVNKHLGEIEDKLKQLRNVIIHAWNFLQKFIKINQTLYFRSF
jgi:hypothetical protein